MLNIRSRVLETNSSSSRSSCNDSRPLSTCLQDNLEIQSDGYVHSSFGSFYDKEFISTERDKLSYILTLGVLAMPGALNNYDYDEIEWDSVISRFRKTRDFQLINQAIIEHFEELGIVCNGLWIDGSDEYIDAGDIFTNDDSIESFLAFYNIPNASVNSYLFKDFVVGMTYN